MERLTSEGGVPARLRGAILALGNFDGFHLGHQAVVAHAVDWARREGRPVLVATFDPHPVRLFQPDAPPFRLTSLAQRERLFAQAGADAMLVFTFDHALAEQRARAFVALLAQDFGAAGVVTGQDFTFGKGREGDVGRLAAWGEPLGLAARSVPPVLDAQGVPVSSSRIRAALQRGDCATATALMTRPFALAGPVIHGDKRGRTIGYPTANMAMDHYLRPAYGIYAVRARLADGRRIDGAANLGVRPSFDPPRELLETHLFNWSGDLYGQTMEVALIARLRPEARFDDLAALTAQMDADCAAARNILSAIPS